MVVLICFNSSFILRVNIHFTILSKASSLEPKIFFTKLWYVHLKHNNYCHCQFCKLQYKQQWTLCNKSSSLLHDNEILSEKDIFGQLFICHACHVILPGKLAKRNQHETISRSSRELLFCVEQSGGCLLWRMSRFLIPPTYKNALNMVLGVGGCLYPFGGFVLNLAVYRESD